MSGRTASQITWLEVVTYGPSKHIIDYRPAVWNFKETWKQIVHYDARSLNAIEKDGAVGKGEGVVEGRRGHCVRHIQRNRNE